MDYALSHRRQIIDATPRQVETADEIIDRNAVSLNAKRIRAINTLGTRWVHHPDYCASRNTHHNPTFKHSAILSCFLHLRSALTAGRV
jgi:hypothetical protein